MKFFLIPLVMVGILMPAHSQNVLTSTIQWNADGFKDNLHQGEGALKSKFITHSSNLIKWKQKDEAVVFDFKVSSIEGQWTNVNKNGSLIYHVIYDNQPGTITISRQGPALKLNMNFEGFKSGEFNYNFSISSLLLL